MWPMQRIRAMRCSSSTKSTSSPSSHVAAQHDVTGARARPARRRRPSHRQDRLDRAVVNKDKQLRRTPIQADFRVAWITALNDDGEHLLEELFRTVYGAVELQAIRVEDYTPARTLSSMQHRVRFHYNRFSFFRVRDLHAVAEHVALFLNPLADGVDKFRRSRASSTHSPGAAALSFPTTQRRGPMRCTCRSTSIARSRAPNMRRFGRSTSC